MLIIYFDIIPITNLYCIEKYKKTCLAKVVSGEDIKQYYKSVKFKLSIEVVVIQ